MSNEQGKGPTFNIDTTVGRSQFQSIGQSGGTAKFEVNEYGSQTKEATAEAFFAELFELVKALPEEERVALEAEALEPARELAVDISKRPTISPDPAEPPPEVQSLFSKIIEKLAPYAPLIVRCTAAFTEASLRSLAENNWAVAGVVAVAGEIRRG